MKEEKKQLDKGYYILTWEGLSPEETDAIVNKFKTTGKIDSYLSKLSYEYLQWQHEQPGFYIGTLNYNLCTEQGRKNFNTLWKHYKKWAIKHFHWILKDTIKGLKLIKVKSNENHRTG